MTHTRIPQAILGLDLGQSEDPSALALLLNIEQIISPHNWIDASTPVTILGNLPRHLSSPSASPTQRSPNASSKSLIASKLAIPQHRSP